MHYTLAFSIAVFLGLAVVVEVPAALNGKELFETRCTNCHDAKIVLTMKKGRRQWNDTIVDMRRNGAKVSNAEAAAIVNYLLKSSDR